MDETALKKILDDLIALPKETEWVEFKQADTQFNTEKLGEYFSALSNEANLKGKECGWLVFGVTDKDRKIVGTQYRLNKAKLDRLKSEVANHTTGRITFIEIHELFLTEGRVIMFQIPAAPKSIPTAWKGHYYGREDESKNALSLQEIEQIRNQVKREDWSAQICPEVTIDNLDPEAISKARKEYKQKYPQKADEVDEWDGLTFLNKAKVTIEGKITRAAVILLGKDESEHFISPAVAQITWILRNEQNQTKDYEHFGPPFIRNTESVFSKIRNLKYRYLPDDTLFPIEINQYEPYVIREA
jgi:ATP-dependent DNA helicase RecG